MLSADKGTTVATASRSTFLGRAVMRSSRVSSSTPTIAVCQVKCILCRCLSPCLFRTSCSIIGRDGKVFLFNRIRGERDCHQHDL